MKNTKVYYEELQPKEFWKRLQEFPVAYLPLGTLEWHCLHMPLGADGIQPRGIFKLMAERYGGIVLPMVFLGPDYRKVITEKGSCYGMDVHSFEEGKHQQFPGSCYYVDDEVFDVLLHNIMRNLKRCGFKIVVAHGHGPSVDAFRKRQEEYQEKYGLRAYTFWELGVDPQEEDTFLRGHADGHETSITMAVAPELVSLENLDQDAVPVGVWGTDPRYFASEERGKQKIEANLAIAGPKLSGIVEEVRTDMEWPEFHDIVNLID